MLPDLKVSSLDRKCVFYRPEHGTSWNKILKFLKIKNKLYEWIEVKN